VHEIKLRLLISLNFFFQFFSRKFNSDFTLLLVADSSFGIF